MMAVKLKRLEKAPTLIGLFFLGLLAQSTASAEPPPAPEDGHEPPVQALRIAQQAVPAESLAAARARCAKDAPELGEAKCLDHYFVPVWLVERDQSRAKGLIQKKLGPLDTGALARSENRILAQALIDELKWKANVNEAELLALQKEFSRPELLRISHLFVHDEKQALALQAQLKPDLSAADFKELVRAHSLDESTKQSGGDLGFVYPDGKTEFPNIRAPQELYVAAQKLKDGEFAAAPVAVEGGFSLIQRRGTLAARKLESKELQALAERQMERSARSQALQELLAKLKKEHAKVHPELLEKIQLNRATER